MLIVIVLAIVAGFTAHKKTFFPKNYSTTEFGDILKAKAGFSLLSLNIQSVASKFSKLETFLVKIEQNSGNPISVIAVQEC